MAQHTATLTVHPLDNDDVYRDRIRIPTIHRGTIGEGVVCKLCVSGKSMLLEVRGLANDPLAHEPAIRLDDITRGKLVVHTGMTYQFEIRESGWIGQFWWAWNASDPAPRIAARLGILGLVLGILGAVLGVISLH
jgi:hypothetical protein